MAGGAPDGPAALPPPLRAAGILSGACVPQMADIIATFAI